MKYFIVYVTFDEDNVKEFLFKSKSGKFLEEQFKRYPNGIISTNKFGISTINALSAYLLEIELKLYPEYSKKDFAIFNENSSYNIVN
ncbi:hypothetical protein V1498_12445 [Peribacillus sp. SCS-26]|uniref:hypothetical protein n=1 Tax=Paraperibacillus marinus TaxID=3115295 RepID=UPI0039057F0F